jgi:hypothetical protein
MPPDDELRELRAQREQIAGHLRWLDQLIANCEAEQKTEAPHVETPEVLAADPSPQPVVRQQQASTTDDVSRTYEFERQFEVKKTIRLQTFGCLTFAFIIVAISFFTLWVLPSLIYD